MCTADRVVTMAKPKALLSWSSGKDSAWALHVLRQEGVYEIVGLVTTVNATVDRVSMHGVRTTLLATQADAVGIPLWKVPIPQPCSDAQYQAAMTHVIGRARQARVAAFAFGDLNLQDVRGYREARLAGSGIAPLFPLWMHPTDILARTMLAGGLQATVTCVDPRMVPAALAGQAFTSAFLQDLPPTVDPCGENGEFHTFAHGGPMFRHEVPIRAGESAERDGFVFADLLPAE